MSGEKTFLNRQSDIPQWTQAFKYDALTFFFLDLPWPYDKKVLKDLFI